MGVHMHVDDILRIPAEDDGDPEGTAAGADVLDVRFAGLGHDSPALMVPAGRIEHGHGHGHGHGVTIVDEQIIGLERPRTPLEAVGGTGPSGA
jgi:hypothetical protein